MNNWPNWQDKLKSPKSEGGLRLKGSLKSSEAGKPLVSYVTVVRNGFKTIRRTIESVQEQTYENIEHIILDGCSTDDTLEIIREYEDRIDYYASEPDQGLYDALNKAIELCRGTLILILNADDWLMPGSAEIAVKNWQPGSQQLILGGARVKFDKIAKAAWYPHPVSLNSYFSVANINHNAIYATREAYTASGPYDASYRIAADTKWILKCFDVGCNFKYLKELVVNYSLGGISSDNYWHAEECKRIIKDRFPYLRGDEVIALNYTYYPWREGLKYPLLGFDPKYEIGKMLTKYRDRQDFIEAIDLGAGLVKGKNSLLLKTVIASIKNRIRKVPWLFSLLRFFYRAWKAIKFSIWQK